MPIKPLGYGSGNKLRVADDASGLTGLPAATGLTGQLPQANGGLGVDASVLNNGVLVKSAGVLTTTTAPSMSGANLQATSVPTAALAASTINLTQPAAGLTVTSSIALGGTATFVLANDLAAVEGLVTTGFVKRTGADTWATQAAISLATDVTGSLSGASLVDVTVTNAKLQNSSITLTQPAAGLTITSSVALGGTATFTLADDLAALEGLGSTGFAVRSGTSTWVQRSIAVGSGLSVSNSDGTSGNPTISPGTELAGLAGLATTGFVQRTGAGTYSTAASIGVSQGGTGSTSYTANGAIVADAAGAALVSTAAPTAAGQYMLWDGVQWVPGLQTGSVYYFRRDASDVATYEQITQTPQTGTEKTASMTLNSGSGTVLFDPYVTNAGEPGLSQFQAGTWAFDIYASVNSVAGGNTTNIVLQVYKRTSGGTETLLFSTTSPALTSTSPTLYSWLYTQAADISLNVTDRLVVKVGATNSSVTNRTVTFYYEGTTHYSHFHPPFLTLLDSGSLVTIAGTQTITGAKTFSTAPVMSGANITSATVPAGSIAGGTVGRLLFDDGTKSAWGPQGPAGYVLQGNGNVIGPTWTNVLTGITMSGASNTFTSIPTSALAAGFNLPVTNGGTGKTVWTAGAIPVASTTTTIGEIAPGSANQVLTSAGTGVAPSMQALPTATTGSASLGVSQYNLTTTSYEDIGLSVTLPSAGTYLVSAEVRTFCQTSASPPGFITVKLYNSTDAADVTNSERFGTVDYTNNGSTDTVPIREVITVAASKTIKVYAKRSTGPTYTNSGVASDSNGRSRLTYIKLSN